MDLTPPLVLVATVAAVGVLHTMVPDHWLPITLIARQRGWSRAQTARAALGAGTGHVVSTLAIGIVVWLGGAVLAQRYGALLSSISSFALVGFGAWIAASSLRELREHAHAHEHGHGHSHGDRALAAEPAADSSRTALLLILGSSPMIEGIPAFFAAGKYGPAVIGAMAAVFAFATIATYVVLCVYSTAGLARVRLGAFEQYGEVLSGVIIMLVGATFFFWQAW
jgi:ABC-type nickel/cobalt efflux system permease component RcnA